MRIIARRTLNAFIRKHPDSKKSLEGWFRTVSAAKWLTPAEVLEWFTGARPIPADRVVFRINGYNYRLVMKINYTHQIVYIRFIGTHGEYDRIDSRLI